MFSPPVSGLVGKVGMPQPTTQTEEEVRKVDNTVLDMLAGGPGLNSNEGGRDQRFLSIQYSIFQQKPCLASIFIFFFTLLVRSKLS